MYMAWGLSCFRTQVYLTQNEKEKLNLLSRLLGKNQSSLIREAIDQYIENQLISKKKRKGVLQEIVGLWADREDLPNFEEVRREFDRS